MKTQATQKETINYIRKENFMNTGLSRENREEIRQLHREVKKFMKWSREEIKSEAENFENYVENECSSGTKDYYFDVIKFLKEDEDLSIIWGYQKYALNTPTLWRWLEKILEVKDNRVNY